MGKLKEMTTKDSGLPYVKDEKGIIRDVGEGYILDPGESWSNFEEYKQNQEEVLAESIIRKNKQIEIESEKKIGSFILNEEETPERIDSAVGSITINEKKYRYYGANILENVEVRKEKGSVWQKKIVNAIILENGRIISKYSRPRGCDFVFDSVMQIKENRWSLSSIKTFVEGGYKDFAMSFRRVHEEFKKKYTESMVFELDGWYDLNAIWDQCTYFYDLIDKSVIIKHEGVSDSAKSKGMKISSNLAFNGRKFLCPTPANYFRYRHNNKSALSIEEAEKLFDDSKKKNVGDSELVEYLNGSYEKGNYVPRQSDKNINITEEFDPFGFTRIGSIKPLKGALEKRSLSLFMIKANPKDKRASIEPDKNDPDFGKCRDFAYVNGLLSYKLYQKALTKVENKYKLINRQWLIAKPLIAMARCIDVKLENEMGNFISKLFTIRDESADENTWESILAKVLVGEFCKHKGSFFISTQGLKSEFVSASETEYKISTNKVTKLMTSLGFGNFRTRSSDGCNRGFELDFFTISEIVVRNGYLTKEELFKKVSEVSDCQYRDEEIGKWYTDTFSDTLQTVKSSSDKLTDLTLSGEVQEETIEDSPDSEVIHFNCHSCGSTPCYQFSKEGRPLCKTCFESKQVQKRIKKTKEGKQNEK